MNSNCFTWTKLNLSPACRHDFREIQFCCKGESQEMSMHFSFYVKMCANIYPRYNYPHNWDSAPPWSSANVLKKFFKIYIAIEGNADTPIPKIWARGIRTPGWVGIRDIAKGIPLTIGIRNSSQGQRIRNLLLSLAWIPFHGSKNNYSVTSTMSSLALALGFMTTA